MYKRQLFRSTVKAVNSKKGGVYIRRRTYGCSFSFVECENALEIPFTEEEYSSGDIPVAFLNCLEKYWREL